MKIIVCGAGQVGRGIAERLSAENNDVTVIDLMSSLVLSLSDSLDVQGIVGHGSHPEVLERAGAADADMIIAVTQNDEVNMMACEVANALFDIPTKIARVRNQSYLQPQFQRLFAKEHTSIDLVISPEIAVGEMVLRRLALPGATEAIYFADDRIIAIGIKLNDECPVLNTPLSQLTELFPDLKAVVVGVFRDNELSVPRTDDQLHDGDIIHVIAEQEQAMRVLGLFGHEERPAKHVVIGGGGNIGLYVARKLEERDKNIRIRIVETDRERAEIISEALKRTVILHGSVLDLTLLEEAGVNQTEAFLALTNDDKVNVLSAMLAKQAGALHSMSLVSSLDAAPLASPLGIDSYIDPRSVTVSSILTHVRRGRIRDVHPVHSGRGEIVEAIALDTSPMIGKPLREANLPDGVRIGAIVREDKVLIPTGDTEIKPQDKIVMFALRDEIKRLQSLFRVSLEYF